LILATDCSIHLLSDSILGAVRRFDCGMDDLNDFLVNKALDYQHQLLEIIKLWFADQDNKTGCLFLVTDAINDSEGFYSKNGFDYLHSSEEKEREYFGIKPGEPMNTRFMFFDLLPHAELLRNA